MRSSRESSKEVAFSHRSNESLTIDEEKGHEQGEITPECNVYSYAMLTAPEQRKKFGTFTVDAGMSYALVCVTVLVQCVLLYCVYNQVVIGNAKWVGGILTTDEGNLIQESNDAIMMGDDVNLFQAPQKCNDGSSLCSVSNGTYSCAPPSLQLAGRWDELDTNKDGLWTRAEVDAARADLKCKYSVDPVEVFDVLVKILLTHDVTHESGIWIHPDLKAGKVIHKAYFTYAMGDVAICGYRNQDMCPNLLKRGVFHSALKYGTAPRIGKTTDSALTYCRKMLEPMGVCEEILPATYATWKLSSIAQCQEPRYDNFVYENPASGELKSLLEVDYVARVSYERAQTTIFQIYKGMICGLWILLVVSQLRRVSKVVTWVVEFPAAEEQDADTIAKLAQMSRNSFVQVKVEGITMRHRIVLLLVNISRMVICFILMYVGLSFLGRQNDYVLLLLDGVALILIIEVQDIVYERVIRPEVRRNWEDSEDMTFAKVGFLKQRPDVVDMIWFLIIVLSASSFMWNITRTMVSPLHDALDCACLSSGDKCFEATRFSKDFWDQYWRFDMPGVFDQINTLKGGFSAWGANLHTGSLTASSIAHHNHHQEQWSQVIRQR